VIRADVSGYWHAWRDADGLPRVTCEGWAGSALAPSRPAQRLAEVGPGPALWGRWRGEWVVADELPRWGLVTEWRTER
jgi:hypothetical protein